MSLEHETLTSLFTDIANSIRGKTGSSATIKADNFPDAIDGIDIHQGVEPAKTVSITSNSQVINPSSGYSSMLKVTANVQAGVVTLNADYATLSSAGSSATSVTSQYFKITPKATVGTSGWIGSISDGSVKNYTVRSAATIALAGVSVTDVVTVGTESSGYYPISAKIKGNVTVGTSGWYTGSSNLVSSSNSQVGKIAKATFAVVGNSVGCSSGGYVATDTTVGTVSSGTSTVQNRTSGGTAIAYGKEVSLSEGYYSATKFYNSVAAGSATGNAGTITYVSHTQDSSNKKKFTVTGSVSAPAPTVSAGYVSSGSAGSATNRTVSLTLTDAQAQAAVGSGTEGTPTATKGTVSNYSLPVTPSVTNVAGYIAGGTKTGTAVSVTPSDLGLSKVTELTQNGATVSIAANKYCTSALSKTVTRADLGITDKAAATYNPSTSDQTINSGYYLTGAQTIKGITAITNSTYAGYLTSSTTARTTTIKSIDGPTTADIYIYPSTNIYNYWASTYGLKINKPIQLTLESSLRNDEPQYGNYYNDLYISQGSIKWLYIPSGYHARGEYYVLYTDGGGVMMGSFEIQLGSDPNTREVYPIPANPATNWFDVIENIITFQGWDIGKSGGNLYLDSGPNQGMVLYDGKANVVSAYDDIIPGEIYYFDWE